MIEILTRSNPYLKKGVKNNFYVMVSIISGKSNLGINEPKKTVLSIALDTSGSMGGSPIENAKETIKKIITSLGKDDKFNLTVYNDSSDLIFKDCDISNKDNIIKKVDSIQAGGNTDILAGLEGSYEVLTSKKFDSSIKRLFLISDGLITSGVKDKEKIFNICSNMTKNGGLNITSFGLGANFDEKLMKGVSNAGKGSYFFIKEKEDIERIVSIAFKETKNLVGTEGALAFKGLNGTKIKKVYCFRAVNNCISIGDIMGDDKRHILFELEIDNPIRENDDYFQYEFSFKKRDGKFATIGGTHSIKIAKNEIEEKIELNEIIAMKAIATSVENDEKIANLIEKNDNDENYSKAVEIQKESIKLLENVQKIDKDNVISLLLIEAKRRLNDLSLKKDAKVLSLDFGNSFSMSQSTERLNNFVLTKQEEKSPTKKRKRDQIKKEEKDDDDDKDHQNKKRKK